MKAEDIRNLSLEELSSREEDLKSEFFNLKVQFATGKLENPIRLRMLRRDIARVKTIAIEMKEKK
jgi:large subunit ribosomal protein L29